MENDSTAVPIIANQRARWFAMTGSGMRSDHPTALLPAGFCLAANMQKNRQFLNYCSGMRRMLFSGAAWLVRLLAASISLTDAPSCFASGQSGPPA